MSLRCQLLGHSPTPDTIRFDWLGVTDHGWRCERCDKPLPRLGMRSVGEVCR